MSGEKANVMALRPPKTRATQTSDYQGREIAALSALASLDGVDAQLKVHIRIATNVGLSEAQLTTLAAVLSGTVGKQEGFRRLAEKKARDHAGFSFVFKARRQVHSRTM
jgi:hypothetical protein